MTARMAQMIALGWCVSSLACEWGCSREPTATECPKERSVAGVDESESHAIGDVAESEEIYDEEVYPAILDETRATDIATRYNQGSSERRSLSEVGVSNSSLFESVL